MEQIQYPNAKNIIIVHFGPFVKILWNTNDTQTPKILISLKESSTWRLHLKNETHLGSEAMRRITIPKPMVFVNALARRYRVNFKIE